MQMNRITNWVQVYKYLPLQHGIPNKCKTNRLIPREKPKWRGGVPGCTEWLALLLNRAHLLANTRMGRVQQSWSCAQMKASKVQMALLKGKKAQRGRIPIILILLSKGSPQNADSFGDREPAREEGFLAAQVGATYPRNKTKVDQRPYSKQAVCPRQASWARKAKQHWQLPRTQWESQLVGPAKGTISRLPHQIVTGPKSMCPTLRKVKTQNVSLE